MSYNSEYYKKWYDINIRKNEEAYEEKKKYNRKRYHNLPKEKRERIRERQRVAYRRLKGLPLDAPARKCRIRRGMGKAVTKRLKEAKRVSKEPSEWVDNSLLDML